jgi:2,3-bisphosphoglycerate-dependent phosphoglycerate mutase
LFLPGEGLAQFFIRYGGWNFMRFYFIRHGQSANNALWDETGANRGRSEDPELTPIGHEQARILADFIAQKDLEARADGKDGEPKRDFFGFTHLYTSLMVRSVATATYVSRALSLPLVGWPEIHECGGIYMENEKEGDRNGLPGKTRDYFAKNYSGLCLPETVAENGWWNRPYEMEEDRPLRAGQVLATLLERHGATEDRVAIVSHGGFYMELMRVMFKIGERSAWFMMNNTAISCFDFDDEGDITLAYHNRTDHLPERLVT